MDWFTILYCIICLTAQGFLQLTFTCCFTKKHYGATAAGSFLTYHGIRIWHYVLYLFLLYIIDGTARVFSLSDIAAVLIQFLTLYWVTRFLYGCSSDSSLSVKDDHGTSRSVSCAASVLAVYITQISFGLITPIELLLFPNFLGKRLLYLLLILATVAAFALAVVCFHLILSHFSPESGFHKPYIWMLLPPVFFFFTAELYILHTTYTQVSVHITLPEIGMHLSLLILQALGLAALFCALYAYKSICHSFQIHASFAALKQEAHAQKTYVTEAQIRYRQTKAFRHDIKNHLSVLEGLLKKEELLQAKNYLQKLIMVTNELSFPCQTGNPVVDILLTEKLTIAGNDGIDSEISLSLPAECTVEDLDWCVLFGNALDNAVNACRELKNNFSSEYSKNSSFIRISGEQQGNFYMLEFENTCLPGTLPTAGIGLSNIKAVTEKYGGTMIIEKSDSLFRLNIILDIAAR